MHFGTSGPQGGDIPPVAYQLADHLDAALAAAEDLAAAGRTWVPATAPEGYELAAQMAAERQVIERVRTFEAVLIGRVLKARKRAQLLAHEAGDFAVMTRLFIGGTAPLVDVVEELGDSTRADFETGDLIHLGRIDAVSTNAAAKDAFTWRGDVAFTHTAGELRFEVSGDDLVVQGDVDGDGVADFEITLTGVSSLVASDFVL